MITPAEALARLGQPESEGRISASASANIRRWLTEAPFARYRDRLLEDIEQRAVARARRRLLRRARVWHRRPPRQDVPGRHQRPQRADDRRERAGTGRLCDVSQGRRLTAIVRDRPRHAASFRGIRPALRPGSRGGRLQGLPFQRAAVDPPALLCRPAPALRRRDHGDRLAQSARPTMASSATADRADRSFPPTMPASSPASRRPLIARSPRSRSLEALADGSIVVGRQTRSISLISPPS